MRLELKESDRVSFGAKTVAEMERQHATVELTSKRYSRWEFNGITVFDVRKIEFTEFEVVVTCLTKGNSRKHQIFFPLGFLNKIKCCGVFWSSLDDE